MFRYHLFCLSLIFGGFGIHPIFGQSNIRNYAQHVEIIRDSFGIPHIYGDTDPDVAYGLAWANAEDDFNTIQEIILGTKGLLGKIKGKDGVVMDYFAQVLRTDYMVDSLYNQSFTSEFKKYLEGYAAGLNAYAASNPKHVWIKKAFPVTAKDVVKGYYLSLAFVSEAQKSALNIIRKKIPKDEPTGSNAFAFNQRITENGNTIVVVNPHMPFEGFFSWYEAHLVSREGLDVMGALFHGGTNIFVGANRHLAWSHTWNEIDAVDVYRLTIRKGKKRTLEYKMDGLWKTLFQDKIRLKIKTPLGFSIPVPRKIYYSEHGPVIKEPKSDRFFALRFPSLWRIAATEEWFNINKATNFSEFQTALRKQQVPRFNYIYGDKEGNLFYINNGCVPMRAPGYDWKRVVPGDTSATLWHDILPLDSLAQLTNPDCGYVFNTNNTPFNATCEESDITKGLFNPHIGYKLTNNNRSHRFMELIGQHDRLNFEDIKKIKFDNQYPQKSEFLESVIHHLQQNFTTDTTLRSMANRIIAWNRLADPNSVEAGWVLVTFHFLFKALQYNDQNFHHYITIPLDVLEQSFVSASKHLMKYFGTLEVPLGEIQRIRRGDKDYTLPGFPDVLAANYSRPAKDGRFKAFVGDSYTMIIEFDAKGPLRVETLSPFGSSARKESPHFTDQMELFRDQKTKPMTFDEALIRQQALRIYRPQ